MSFPEADVEKDVQTEGCSRLSVELYDQKVSIAY